MKRNLEICRHCENHISLKCCVYGGIGHFCLISHICDVTKIKPDMLGRLHEIDPDISMDMTIRLYSESLFKKLEVSQECTLYAEYCIDDWNEE